MLKVNAPANLGIIQAVLRKIDTFDIIDGEWIKINIYCYLNRLFPEIKQQKPGYDYYSFIFAVQLIL